MVDLLLSASKEAMVKTAATSKGRITIPSSLRRKLGIKPGTRIWIEADESSHRIILTPITRAYVHSLRGRYRGRGLLKALLVEKNRERESERIKPAHRKLR